ncbi:hypothetical protein PsYK624_164910 [Phanerochaete sordida]|uniref:BTB domain-containing protein n=1 Tax=Phanerochaete sordida TaxID=48140 RepID=A0A9P3LMA1_9APHY|nr:hypothetical protein PsYK624_164910 [Phanerochaete sordida]
MSTPLHTLAKVPSGGSLEDALADALSGKPFNDVTFYTLAREEGGGKRRAVHANSRILTSSSKYFRELLAEEVGDGPAPNALSESTATLTGTARDDEDASTLSDDDDIDALESLLATPSEVSFGGDEETKLPDSASEYTKNVSTAVSATSGTRVVTLDNVEPDTLEAVIFYIYTGNVYFRPLRSQDSRVCEDAKATYAPANPKRPACCCKAVYCFADQAGLDELKELADAHLFAQLDKDNILDEVFSPFSAKYPIILRRQVAFLLEKHWTSATHARSGPLVERIVRGEMPHAAPALAMLLGEISPGLARSECSLDGKSKGPLPPDPSPANPSLREPLPANLSSARVPATGSPSAAVSPARPAPPGCAPGSNLLAGSPPASASIPTSSISGPASPSVPPGSAGGAGAGEADAAAESVTVRPAARVTESAVPARGPAIDATAVPAQVPGAASASDVGGESRVLQKRRCKVCKKKTIWTVCWACKQKWAGMVKPADSIGSTRVADGGGVASIASSGT